MVLNNIKNISKKEIVFNEQHTYSEFLSFLGFGETCEIKSNVLNLIKNNFYNKSKKDNEFK